MTTHELTSHEEHSDLQDQDQALIEIGRILVSETMWHVLRTQALPWVAQPDSTALKPNEKEDAPKKIDLIAEKVVHRILAEAQRQDLPLGRGCLVVTEERGLNFTVGPASELKEDILVFVDPVDYTSAACRGLDGSVLISFWNAHEGEIRAAVAGDLYRRRIYWRRRGHPSAAMRLIFPEEPTRIFSSEGQHLDPPGGIPLDLQTTGKTTLELASVNIFVGKPERLTRAVQLAGPLWEWKSRTGVGIGEIFSVGGSLGPIRVADGSWDLSIEIAKGFRTWDFAPGAFIAAGAEGVSVVPLSFQGGKYTKDDDSGAHRLGDRDCKFDISPTLLREWIKKRFDKDTLDASRKRFIVAASEELAEEVLAVLNSKPKDSRTSESHNERSTGGQREDRNHRGKGARG